jgi:hypothetical protein
VQALQCLGPQGVGGGRFESPLESMWKALARSQTPDDPDLVRREGVAVPGGTVVTATCELSPSKAVDCPDLPWPCGSTMWCSPSSAANCQSHCTRSCQPLRQSRWQTLLPTPRIP